MKKLYLFNVYTFYKIQYPISLGSPFGLSYGPKYIFNIYMILSGWLACDE